MGVHKSESPYFDLFSLPKEIVDVILENLSNDKRALRQCSQLCRRLYPRSQELLFALWQPNRCSSIDVIRSIEQLSQVIESSPHIAAYIREFDIYLGALNDSSNCQRYLEWSAFSAADDAEKCLYPYGAVPFLILILRKLSRLHTLRIMPLTKNSFVNWDYYSEVPEELRQAIALTLRGRIFERVALLFVNNFDPEVFRETTYIRRLEMYSTTIRPLHGPLTTSSDITAHSPRLLQRCKVMSITYHTLPAKTAMKFMEYCTDSLISSIELDAISHLSIRDLGHGPSPNPLSTIFGHCGSGLTSLELAYDCRLGESQFY